MNANEIITSYGTDLVKESALYEPMLYYGSKPRISIQYVSDLHLLHHVSFYDGNLDKTINAFAKNLYQSTKSSSHIDIRLFIGDVSSNRDVTVSFYKRFRLYVVYSLFKSFKRELNGQKTSLSFECKRAEYIKRRNRISKYISKKEVEVSQIKERIKEYLDYNKIIAPKGSTENIRTYLASNYYKRRNLSDCVEEMILTVASLQDTIAELHNAEMRIERVLERSLPDKLYSLSDFRYKQSGIIGIVILGNHEYIGFPTVDDAVVFYKRELEPLGYRVLQNEFIEEEKYVLYGGSGFAKYSEQYNANTLFCCDAMMGNRAYEIEQTNLFEQGYERAKSYALRLGKCFICAAHYPVDSCLGRCDRETVYFTGHTHRNERIRTEEQVLYADNQVGYHKNGKFDGVIQFKVATTDFVRNPYDELKDGFYLTTPDLYLRFYDYIGEYIGEGKMIRQRCENGQLYVIKSRGYYGFFIVNESGLSVVNGGKTKKIALSKNIKWIYDNFNIVVDKYLAALEPLRAKQVQISNAVKRLGFSGKIHGLIVDIDFFDHIMVNPINGSITCYYSPAPGVVKTFESFDKLLEFRRYAGLLRQENTENTDIKQISSFDPIALIESHDNYNNTEIVSMKDGAYGLSRQVSPLQRLFTGHVLREFDLRMVEVQDESAPRRSLSLFGRIYSDEDSKWFVVIRDDLGEYITLLDDTGNETLMTIQRIRSSMSNKERGRAHWVTKDITETVEKYVNELPVVWREALGLE